MNNYDIISERQEKVLRYLDEHGIPFTTYNHHRQQPPMTNCNLQVAK